MIERIYNTSRRFIVNALINIGICICYIIRIVSFPIYVVLLVFVNRKYSNLISDIKDYFPTMEEIMVDRTDFIYDTFEIASKLIIVIIISVVFIGVINIFLGP